MDHSAILPNGKSFEFWEVPVTYKKEIHVNQNHPMADDANEGTLEKPLKTINAAAKLATAGSRVLIHGGEYRECVHPTAGGSSPENMVSFEAYGDDEVVIKASELVTDFNPSTGWRVQGNFKDEIDREKIRIWEYRLNPELFKGYNPFCAVNILHDRLFIESGWEGEIEDVVQDIDRRIRQEQFIGDVHPTDLAPVIEMENQRLKLNICRWGYSLSKGKNLVINARVESVLDKPSFKNGIQYHRILIPASGFYEWNQLKEKNMFTRSDSTVMYLTGFCDWFENERRFVILTMAANESMKKVHDRMPLILEKEQLRDWFSNDKMKAILHQKSVMLKRQAEYEQQSLFW